MASKAVGYVYHANRAPSKESTLAQRKMYGTALKQLQLALGDPKLRNQDDILMSVWLLCLYELMLGTSPDGKGPLDWSVHSRALTGLIRSRGKEQFKTKTGRQLFQLSYHYIQIQCFQTGSDPPPEAREWFDAIESSDDGNQYMFMPSFHFGNQAARICKEAKSSCGPLNSTAEKIAAIENAVQTCKAFEMSMNKTIDDLFAGYTASKAVLLTTKLNQNISVLRVSNHHDTCLLRLYTVLLELIQNVISQPGISTMEFFRLLGLQQTCMEESQLRISRILEVLPHFLTTGQNLNLPNWADSLKLMWPLRGVLCSPAAHETQMWMAKQGLRTIAYEGGIMQAVGSFFSNITIYESP
ncbi:hypothetical protein N7448_001103 [Penicillium atrosanguineum]|nr:hypothetical protein N7526_005242 [Penicillium atrosanguineum]KAJ5149525.1 hypothetical protein N7448_001103 [Penicillium atrosanguineum]